MVEADFKDDIIMLQFKLTHKESGKRVNTLTFLNVPLSQSSDPNIAILEEIVLKLKNPLNL